MGPVCRAATPRGAVTSQELCEDQMGPVGASLGTPNKPLALHLVMEQSSGQPRGSLHRGGGQGLLTR